MRPELLKTICDARAGKRVPMVRLFWTISLEYWLRDLAERGLLDTHVSSPSPLRQRSCPGRRLGQASNDLPSALNT